MFSIFDFDLVFDFEGPDSEVDQQRISYYGITDTFASHSNYLNLASTSSMVQTTNDSGMPWILLDYQFTMGWDWPDEEMGDVALGKKVFKKCAACHSIVKGGKNNIGPALYNVVGRQIGSISDYKYSKALSAYGKEWTFEELNGYLTKPAKWINGTKMAFAGLRKESDRASVIKYLNQNSDNPVPLP